jgi:hypothetical protein
MRNDQAVAEITLEFLANNNARILDEIQRMRRDLQFIHSDYRLIRHDLTGAVMRLEAIDEKFGAAVERLDGMGKRLGG